MSHQSVTVETNPETAPGWLADVKAWVLDVDGCLVSTTQAGGVGGTAFPGADDFIKTVKAAGHTVVVCTNASGRTPAAYAGHLRDLGLDVENDEFVSAGLAAAEYVANFHPGERVLFVAEEGVTEPAKALGVNIIDPADKQLADVVVVGAVETIDKAHLNAAALAVDAGAPLYSTTVNPWFHGGQEKSLAISAAVAATIGWASGNTAEVVGKPSTALADTLRLRLGVPVEQIAVVGDAPAEIGLARHMGAKAITVLSGAIIAEELHSPDNPSGSQAPDLAVDDIGALHRLRQS